MTRGIIISACLSLGHFSKDIAPADATAELKNAICLGFMIIPAIALIIAVLALLFGFKLTREKVKQYSAKIAARS